jgi:magnesium-transporting ATPase (P-type)
MLIVELGIKKLAWSNLFIKYILSYLIQAITVVVVAVPEGLPLAVTLALAYAVQVGICVLPTAMCGVCFCAID